MPRHHNPRSISSVPAPADISMGRSRRLSTIHSSELFFLIIIVCGALLVTETRAQRLSRKERSKEFSVPKSIDEGVRTMGGRQFWTDFFLHSNWRIQRNALSKHFRLLDDQNRRFANGSFEHCLGRFQQLASERQLGPLPSSVTLLLHGLADHRGVMADMHIALRDTHDHYVMSMTYSSTRDTVDAHAEGLSSILRHFGPEVKRVNLVGYSLGNLVIRRYWAMAAEAGKRPDPRVFRIVMLGPPNQGAQLATKLGHNNPLFGLILGKTGNELGIQWNQLDKRLAVPTCEFAIIAGSGRRASNNNPILDGEDDTIVRVEETKLSGARDFAILPVTHTKMPSDKTVIEYTARFLKSGWLVSPEARHPLPTNPIQPQAPVIFGIEG